MTTIYLSAKLQALFPPFDAEVKSTYPNAALGDWNGHVFTLNRKRYLLFINNKTYYAVILAGVLKKDLLNFSAFSRNIYFSNLLTITFSALRITR